MSPFDIIYQKKTILIWSSLTTHKELHSKVLVRPFSTIFLIIYEILLIPCSLLTLIHLCVSVLCLSLVVGRQCLCGLVRYLLFGIGFLWSRSNLLFNLYSLQDHFALIFLPYSFTPLLFSLHTCTSLPTSFLHCYASCYNFVYRFWRLGLWPLSVVGLHHLRVSLLTLEITLTRITLYKPLRVRLSELSLLATSISSSRRYYSSLVLDLPRISKLKWIHVTSYK